MMLDMPLAEDLQDDLTKVLMYVCLAETFILEVKYLTTSTTTDNFSDGMNGIIIVRTLEGMWVTNIVGIGPIRLTIWAATMPPQALMNPHNINTAPMVDSLNFHVRTYQNDMKLLITNPPPKASRANRMLVTMTILQISLSLMPTLQNSNSSETTQVSLTSISQLKQLYMSHFTKPQKAQPMIIILCASTVATPQALNFSMTIPANKEPTACAPYPAMLYQPKILAIQVSFQCLSQIPVSYSIKSVSMACQMDRNGPTSPPDKEMTPKIPDIMSRQKLLERLNMTPVETSNNDPIASTFFLPSLSALVVRYIVMKRSPIMMQVNSMPIQLSQIPISVRQMSKGTDRQPYEKSLMALVRKSICTSRLQKMDLGDYPCRVLWICANIIQFVLDPLRQYFIKGVTGCPEQETAENTKQDTIYLTNTQLSQILSQKPLMQYSSMQPNIQLKINQVYISIKFKAIQPFQITQQINQSRREATSTKSETHQKIKRPRGDSSNAALNSTRGFSAQNPRKQCQESQHPQLSSSTSPILQCCFNNAWEVGIQGIELGNQWGARYWCGKLLEARISDQKKWSLLNSNQLIPTTGRGDPTPFSDVPMQWLEIEWSGKR